MEGFLFTGVFWGGILILAGLAMIINAIFHVDIPVFKLVFAFIFIYFGLKVLGGGFRFTGEVDKNTIIFNDGRLSYQTDSRDNEYNVIFGKGIIDLSNVSAENAKKIKVNAIFGEAVIEINAAQSVRAEVNAVFAASSTPDETQTAFGQHVYKTASYTDNSKSIQIEGNAVFGGLRIVTK